MKDEEKSNVVDLELFRKHAELNFEEAVIELLKSHEDRLGLLFKWQKLNSEVNRLQTEQNRNFLIMFFVSFGFSIHYFIGVILK